LGKLYQIFGVQEDDTVLVLKQKVGHLKGTIPDDIMYNEKALEDAQRLSSLDDSFNLFTAVYNSKPIFKQFETTDHIRIVVALSAS
jgi:hypothetical protein